MAKINADLQTSYALGDTYAAPSTIVPTPSGVIIDFSNSYNAYQQVAKNMDEKDKEEWKKVTEMYHEYVKAYYDHYKRMLKYQKWCSWFIMLIVGAITLSGIAFSAWQLRIASQLGNQILTNTQINITSKEVMINSSVIGLVVLVISIAFFYLYLRYLNSIGTPRHIGSFRYPSVTESESENNISS